MAIFISALISDLSRRYRPRALARGRYRRLELKHININLWMNLNKNEKYFSSDILIEMFIFVISK